MGAYEIVVVDELIGGTVEAEAQQRHGGKHDDDNLSYFGAHGFLSLQTWQVGSCEGQQGKQCCHDPLRGRDNAGIAEVVDATKKLIIGILQEESAQPDDGYEVENAQQHPSHWRHQRLVLRLLLGKGLDLCRAHACRRGVWACL